MKILVINAGSSSLKYQLFSMTNSTVLAKGICERIGTSGTIKHQPTGKADFVKNLPLADHKTAVQHVFELLVSKEYGVIDSIDEIAAVGHRVLHGGIKFSGSVIIDDAVLEAIEECVDLGPLHNPPNIVGIKACEALMPKKPQVAVFDTGFGQTMPKHAYMYGLPYEMYEKFHIRRYGFHGTSHRYVSGKALQMLKNPNAKIVTCHLGNGSSISAIDSGKCVDTSMGLTPLEGLTMGTRCGSIDPAIVTYLCDKGYTPKEINDMMNKSSGFIGISGETSDYRDLCQLASEGNEKAALAVRMFEYQIKKLIGSYAAAMAGLDAVVFTGGIGENAASLRQNIGDKLAFMGLGVDPEKNNIRGIEADVSTANATVKTLIIPTNEELMIALDTMELVK